MSEQQRGPTETARDLAVGQKFKLNRTTYAVTKVGPKMLEAKPAKGDARWFWRRSLEKAKIIS